jgi:FkbM family methyltransferase
VGIATVVYKQYLVSRGIAEMAWSFSRKVLIKHFNDPKCSLQIHGRRLSLPLSHQLPAIMKYCRFYDQLPHRISEYIHQHYNNLICIDVGANVGDTIASLYKSDADVFLAIEPNPKFCSYLRENWGWNNNITIVEEICSSVNDSGNFIIEENRGTARIFQIESGIKRIRRTLDDIVDEYPFVSNANFIKIDTDGNDFEVLKGAKKMLSRNIPMILFECDAFENTNYVDDCIKTLLYFKDIGYNHFLLYNDHGNIMGKYPLSDLSTLKNLLFFEMTSDAFVFDILVMNDDDLFKFHKVEIEYFTDQMVNKSLKQTAISAIDLNY